MSARLFLGCARLSSIFHFVSPYRRGCNFCPPWLDLCGVSVAWRFGFRPGAPGSDSPPFRPRGSAYILRSFPYVPCICPYYVFRNFLFILHLLLFALCREVRARGRGGAHSHATKVAAAFHTLKGGMRVALSRTGIGLLAQPESVLALAPPAAPSAVLASLWRGRWSGGAPFCFPFFFLPVFPPPLVRLFTLKLEKGSRVRADSG